jgi:ubiquinone/menaquinone biosynthesis C-methylase UbiE
MAELRFGDTLGASPPINYERFFVPAIGAPLATDLVSRASLSEGERVLDVACGTGIVARLASKAVGSTGAVAGLDANPGMLAVARSSTPPELHIEWHEASADAIPLPDASFDAVLCQMGLQFMSTKTAALREMRRVLVSDGRLTLNVPGPTPRLFTIMGEALARNVAEEAAGFVNQVFALHDTGEIQSLLNDAGFHDVSVHSETKTLNLPAPEQFLWQYIHSTPLAGAVAQAADERLDSLETEVVAKWQEFETDHGMALDVRVVSAAAGK